MFHSQGTGAQVRMVQQAAKERGFRERRAEEMPGEVPTLVRARSEITTSAMMQIETCGGRTGVESCRACLGAPTLVLQASGLLA